MGKASAVTNEEKSAREIVDEFVDQAVEYISKGNASVVSKAKL